MAAPEQLVEQESRHGVYVQRYGGYLANLFNPILDDLMKEVRLILLDNPDPQQNLRKINSIVNEIRRAQVAAYGEYNDDILFDSLEEFSIAESEWEVKSLKSVIDSPSVDIVPPAPVQVWAAVNSAPLVFPDSNGVKLLEPFIKDWEKGQVEKVGNIIRTGFITGKTTDQIVSEVTRKNGYMDTTTRQSIKSMVITSTNHSSNVAKLKTMSENEGIVIGYEIVAVLDSRTSNICKGYDGTIVKNTDDVKPRPPFHPRCRTQTVATLDGRYSIDKAKGSRASKGAEGGQQVSADTSYYAWLKRQGSQGKNGRAFVEDVLGIERAKLFLDGGLSADKFKQLTLDEHFQPIPLDELKKKQSLQLAFDKVS